MRYLHVRQGAPHEARTDWCTGILADVAQHVDDDAALANEQPQRADQNGDDYTAMRNDDDYICDDW